MTEAEWLASKAPQPMLDLRRGQTSERKLRLFTVACCRGVWSMLRNPKKESAVETAERYADGLASDSELKVAAERAWGTGKPLYPPAKLLVKATTTKSALAGADFAVGAWAGMTSEDGVGPSRLSYCAMSSEYFHSAESRSMTPRSPPP
jgi:hypothetical protein